MGFFTKLKIKNFSSIKNEVEVDFISTDSNIENDSNRLFNFNGKYYNKVVSFYGANASGKSTVLNSLVFVANVINNEKKDDFPLAFKNKFANKSLNTSITIQFVLDIEGELIEFEYYLEVLTENDVAIGIKNEKLSEINNNRKFTVFNRSKAIIKNVDKNIQEQVFSSLSKTKTLFQEFEKFDSRNYLAHIIFFFRGVLGGSNSSVFNTQYSANSRDENTLGVFLNKEKDNHERFGLKIKEFIRSFLNSVNIDIEEIETTFDEKEKAKVVKGIELFHKYKKKVPLEFKLESDGTQMLMKKLLDIFMIKIGESVLVVDEFDSVLHPMLTPLLINLLCENDIQIIYTTHNIYNMKFLYKDELFLIEKNSEHETKIIAIKDNPKIEGYENLLAHYENGLLGGTPNIKNIITDIL